MKLIPIQGYYGKYSAGEDGHIYCYSKARNNRKKSYPFPLKESIWGNGYPFVSLIGKKKKTAFVHILVCKTFHGNKPKNADCTRHLDGSKTNNRPDNLQWGTWYENEADKRRHGKTAKGEKQGSAKLTGEGVRIIRASIPCGLWDVGNCAKVFNVDPSTIRRIAQGKDWKHI